MTDGMTRETILVLDYGSQYSQLITRRVRECQVYCEMLPWDANEETIRSYSPRGIILSGGPNSVYDEGAPSLSPFILELGVPVLGICYGMQLFAYNLGGQVIPSNEREYGLAFVELDVANDPLLGALEFPMQVWMSHGDRLAALPEGFVVTSHSTNSPYASMSNVSRGLYGLQFHPEVVHTTQGMALLNAFCRTICGCSGNWTAGSFVEEAIDSIRKRVGDRKVICGVSGGVDSTVVATLLSRAIGDQLTAIFVDNGLLRKDEAQETVDRYEEYLDSNLVYVDASKRFLHELEGVTDPETKRHIIGHTFVDVFESEAAKLGHVDFLAQGTLYPDVIESATSATTKSAARIKTHHNVGGLPEDMRMELIEPLRFLFKDEVRAVGMALDLPEEMVYRPPFPGPGLAVRIIGDITAEKLATLRDADAIVREEIAAAGLDREIWQYFAVLTNIRSVGVMGDGRTYAYVVAIRAITSEDGMTADWARIPAEVLARMSNRIVNEVAAVNRVVYDISSKPPATIEWE